jgi:predicted transposase YbfD/YdcC
MVRRKTTVLTARGGKAAATKKPDPDETRFYVSSLTLSPLQILSTVINHWNVETAHWYLDMAFYEDDSKIYHGHAAENLSTLRKIACNFALPQSRLREVSLARVMEKAHCNPAYLSAIMVRKPIDVGPLSAWKVSPEKGFHEIPCQVC